MQAASSPKGKRMSVMAAPPCAAPWARRAVSRRSSPFAGCDASRGAGLLAQRRLRPRRSLGGLARGSEKALGPACGLAARGNRGVGGHGDSLSSGRAGRADVMRSVYSDNENHCQYAGVREARRHFARARARRLPGAARQARYSRSLDGGKGGGHGRYSPGALPVKSHGGGHRRQCRQGAGGHRGGAQGRSGACRFPGDGALGLSARGSAD